MRSNRWPQHADRRPGSQQACESDEVSSDGWGARSAERSNGALIVGDALRPPRTRRLLCLSTGTPSSSAQPPDDEYRAHARTLPTRRHLGHLRQDRVAWSNTSERSERDRRLARTIRAWEAGVLAFHDRPLQPADRGDQLVDQEGQTRRPRLPRLQQLPATAPVALRRHLPHCRHRESARPPTTLHRVEPRHSAHPTEVSLSSGCGGVVGAPTRRLHTRLAHARPPC